MKPFSEACERNKRPILAHLKNHLGECESVLEVGSGTGQHAVHFAAQLPHLIWHTADLARQHAGIQAWLQEAALTNIRGPHRLNLDDDSWPVNQVDAVYSANTCHIVSQNQVERLIAGAGRVLGARGLLLLYGPFNYQGHYTSESNQRFDQFLRARDPQSGIRDFEWVDQLAQKAGFKQERDYEMPANNRLIIWNKQIGEQKG